MIIRLAEDKDLQAIYDLGFDSYSAEAVRNYDTVINKEKAKDSVANLVKNKTVFVATDNEKIIGVMVGMISDCIFSNDLIYSTLFFFMADRYRHLAKDFLQALETILKYAHVTKFVISNPELNHGGKIERFYLMNGFKRLEVHMIKNIKAG
jgi:hypothetical protein